MPVEVAAPTSTVRIVDIVLGGRILRVPADIESDELRRLVRAVEAA
jgi:hypothetical protein